MCVIQCVRSYDAYDLHTIMHSQRLMGWGYIWLCCHLVGSRSLIAVTLLHLILNRFQSHKSTQLKQRSIYHFDSVSIPTLAPDGYKKWHGNRTYWTKKCCCTSYLIYRVRLAQSVACPPLGQVIPKTIIKMVQTASLHGLQCIGVWVWQCSPTV